MKTKVRLIISLLMVLLSVGILTFGIISAVEGYKSRKRNWFREKVNPHIRVEVVNAAGVTGLARKVTYLLRQDGFDVVYYTSFNDTISKTVVVERSDSSLSHAKHLSKWIRCDEITLEWDHDKISDCTIILGMDFYKYFPGIDTVTILY